MTQVMPSSDDVRFRTATGTDVPAMAACRSADPVAGPADPRMAAYFAGTHHPQQALAPRVGYVALRGDTVVGYIAGHRTIRHGCSGEVQYLFVAPDHRRRGLGTAVLRRLADWLVHNGAQKVCVCIDARSPSAKPFYEHAGAAPFRQLWYRWDDVSLLLR